MNKALTRLFLCLLVVSLVGASACGTTSAQKEQQFYSTVVACSKSDKANDSVKSAALSCLSNAVAGNYAACMTSIVPDVVWTVDEIQCVANSYAH
jgi:hypothetical protein